MEKRTNERYVLMVDKFYYNSGRKPFRFIYSNDLKELFATKQKIIEQKNNYERKYGLQEFYYIFKFFDYRACRYIDEDSLIMFIDNEPIQTIVRWGLNGRQYVWKYIDEKQAKKLIKKYGIDTYNDHLLWLQS